MTNHPVTLLLPAALAILMPGIAAAQATAYETIYSFHGAPDGSQPEGALVIDSDGVLYGTTYSGGASNLGTVFELTKPTGEPWKETVLHSFSGSDGQFPASTLTLSSEGALYGTTTQVAYGGGVDNGTIFEVAPPSTAGGAWTETVLYSFIYGRGDPQNVLPNGTLLPGPGGTLYTTTQGLFSEPGGLVIALAPPATAGGSWTEYQLYAFGEPVAWAGGAEPRAGLGSVKK